MVFPADFLMEECLASDYQTGASLDLCYIGISLSFCSRHCRNVACSLTVRCGSVGSALSPHAGVICWLGHSSTPTGISCFQSASVPARNDLQESLCAWVQQAGSSSCLSLSSDTWINPAIICLRDSCQPQGSREVLGKKKRQPPTLLAPNCLFVLFVCVIDLSAC